MASQPVTIHLPEPVYLRLRKVAEATQQTLDDVLVRVLQVGSHPSWEDAPAEFQNDLAALDRMDDSSPWQVARSTGSQNNIDFLQSLLDKRANGTLCAAVEQQIGQRRAELDRLLIKKAHAVALLRWRGHTVPPAERL